MKIPLFFFLFACSFLLNQAKAQIERDFRNNKNAPNEAIVGRYSGKTSTLILTFAQAERAFKEAFEENGIKATLDSVYISDEPTTKRAVPCLIIKGRLSNGEIVRFGSELERNNGRYKVSAFATWWKCSNKKNSGCNDCTPERENGHVVACSCSNSPVGKQLYCNFEIGGEGGDVSVAGSVVRFVLNIVGYLTK